MNEFEEWWKNNGENVAFMVSIEWGVPEDVFKKIAQKAWDAARVGEYDGVIPPRSDK